MEQLKQGHTVRTIQRKLLRLDSLNLIIKSNESRGRFVKWSLNQEFNAPSTRHKCA
jgi:hypothetical protein